MNITNLFFRDTFIVDASYDKVVSFLKMKLNDTYFKGYIDNNGLQVFYSSGFIKEPFSSTLPIIQVNVENNTDKGKIKIRFKLVDFITILF